LSDKALGHACYLSKLSGAEIIILNVIEHVKNTDSSALTATSKEEGPDKSNEKLGITLEGGLKQMVDEKIRHIQISCVIRIYYSRQIVLQWEMSSLIKLAIHFYFKMDLFRYFCNHQC
jgi:hypothetical protein